MLKVLLFSPLIPTCNAMVARVGIRGTGNSMQITVTSQQPCNKVAGGLATSRPVVAIVVAIVQDCAFHADSCSKVTVICWCAGMGLGLSRRAGGDYYNLSK